MTCSADVLSSVPVLYVAVTIDTHNSLRIFTLPHFLSRFLLSYLPSDYIVAAVVHIIYRQTAAH